MNKKNNNKNNKKNNSNNKNNKKSSNNRIKSDNIIYLDDVQHELKYNRSSSSRDSNERGTANRSRNNYSSSRTTSNNRNRSSTINKNKNTSSTTRNTSSSRNYSSNPKSNNGKNSQNRTNSNSSSIRNNRNIDNNNISTSKSNSSKNIKNVSTSNNPRRIGSRSNNTSSRSNNTSSRSNNMSSRSNNTSSRSNNMSSRSNNTSSRSNNMSSRSNNTSSRSSNTSSKSNNKNNNKNNNTSKSNKQRNFSMLSTIFMSSIFFFMVIYFGISAIKSLNKPIINYATIEVGSIDNYTQVEGVIIRDEVVYTASKEGSLTIEVPELEKVKTNQQIASIKNVLQTQETEAELELIYAEILSIQEKRGDLSLFSADVLKLEKQIQATIESYIYDISQGDFNKIYEIKEMVDKNIDNRNQLLLSESTGSLESLANQKISKENELNKNIEVFYSNESGIVSYHVDGYEDKITLENMDSITKEQTNIKADSSSFKLDVSSGDEVFKIVTSNTFYIACYINVDNISTWKENQSRTIYINDIGTLKPLQVVVKSIVHDGNQKEAYVLLESNNNMIDFIDKRNISFEINIPKEGYKIELDAIVIEDLLKIPNSYIIGETVVIKKGAFLNSDGEVMNSEVEISIAGVSKDELYSYINIDKNLLTIGDVIINPNSREELQLNEIETTEGVYITNTGFNTLKSIDITDSIQDEMYIILDQTKNANIKLYDRYLKNAKEIDFTGGLTIQTIQPTTESITNGEDDASGGDLNNQEEISSNQEETNSNEEEATITELTTEELIETTTETI